MAARRNNPRKAWIVALVLLLTKGDFIFLRGCSSSLGVHSFPLGVATPCSSCHRHRHTALRQSSLASTLSTADESITETIPPLVPEYMITHSHTVIATEDGLGLDSIWRLSDDSDECLLGYPTLSQARKGCRLGEIVLLHSSMEIVEAVSNNSDNENENDGVLRRLDPASLNCCLEDDGDWFKTNANHTVSVVPNLQMILCKNDVLARVTRMPDAYYPVQVTGFVQPPKLPCNVCTMPRVVYQDDDVAIVDKPAGLVTIGSDRQDLESLLPFLLTPPGSFKDARLPRPVHRLDRATCGLVVVAKTEQAMQRLSAAFAERRVQKTYTTVVAQDSTTIEWDTTSGIIDYPVDGKQAVSSWELLQQTKRFALLQVRPKTGRMHQIRRHLSYCLKRPVVGDAKYDHGRFREYRSLGLFLCSNALVFCHPTTGEELSFSIPVPTKFQELLDDDEADAAPQESVMEKRVKQVRAEMGFDTDEGVSCTGEPSVDPSKMVNPNQGDSEWMEDW